MELWNSAKTAGRIDKSVSWLNHARQTGHGPRYLKIGHQVRYRPEDIDAWLEQQARTKIWEFDGEAGSSRPARRPRKTTTEQLETIAD
jgi:predicted DNA-binding transcriptional regulator AlpA